MWGNRSESGGQTALTLVNNAKQRDRASASVTSRSSAAADASSYF